MKKLKKIAMSAAVGVSLALGAISAQAAITSTSVSASMQLTDGNNPQQFVSVGQTITDATVAVVDLAPAGTVLRTQSDMTFSSLTAESAVFSFLIGMHGNGYTGIASMGALGPSTANNGILHYNAAAPGTMTVTYDYDIGSPGRDIFGNPVTFGMQFISVANTNFGFQNHTLPGTGPIPAAGHYHSIDTFNLIAGDNSFMVSFAPNLGLSGGLGFIDGQFLGTATFNFDGVAAAVPEPESYAMLLVGLGLLGFAARRRKQPAA